jgi:peroxiredoxin
MSRILLASAILLFTTPFQTLLGQSATVPADSTFQDYMNQAWDQIRETDFSDSLQNVYSVEFYNYYKENPDTETGEKAFAQAFLMWGNTGKSDHIREAIQNLSYDSELWRMIVSPMSNIYARNEDLNLTDYYELLDYLSEKLTDPNSKSAVLLSLLRKNSREDDHKERAVDFARQIVEIDANEFYVTQALGYLHEIESLNNGQKAPDFDLQTIDGDKISLESLEGQYVILEFWATWCGPCIPEIPHLKELYESYHDSGFTIIGISLDREVKTLTDFIEEREMEWPQIYVEDGWTGDISRLFNVSGIPRMYLLDPDGIIIGRDLRGEEMISKVDQLMADAQQ